MTQKHALEGNLNKKSFDFSRTMSMKQQFEGSSIDADTRKANKKDPKVNQTVIGTRIIANEPISNI